MTLKNPLLYRKQSSELIQSIQAGLADRLKAQGWQGQPGGTGAGLTRLFGRMTEVIINRLNQTPEQHFRAFLNEAEIDRLAPRPAHTELTFTPTADNVAIRVPASTQVATRPSPTQPELIFETERDLTVIPTELTSCITVDPVYYSDQTAKAAGVEVGAFTAFAGENERERIFYIGGDPMFVFPDASSRAHATVTLTFAFVQPGDAADGWVLEWLYWDNADPSQAQWRKLKDAKTLITDKTNNFCKDGEVSFSQLPALATTTVNGEPGVWLACKLTGGTSRQHLPIVKRITVSRIIGDDPMFAFLDVERRGQKPKQSDVTLTFAFVPPEVATVPWKLEWLYWNGKAWASLQDTPAQIVDNTDNFRKDGTVTFSQLPELKLTEVNGEPGGWLACRLGGAAGRPLLPIFKAVGGGRVIRASEEVKPNAALTMIQGGSAFVPLDLNHACSPLGQQPALLDTFFLRVDEAFTKAGATVTLKLDLQELPTGLEDTSELEKLEIEWAYSSRDGWTVLGRTKRGCPALEKLDFESLENPNSGATFFAKPTLQTTPLIGGKYLEFVVPSVYKDATIDQLPAPFSQGKLVADIYTGAKYVQIPIPKECETLPANLLLNGCSTAERLNFKDKTCALTSKGVIQFTLPVEGNDNPQFIKDPEFVTATVNGQTGYWLRARIINGSYNVPQKAPQNLVARMLMATPQFLPPLVFAPVLQKLQIFYRNYQQKDPAKPPPTFVTRGHSKTDERWQNYSSALKNRQPFAPYTAAVEEAALYLGFTPLPASEPRVAFPEDRWIQIRIDVDEAGGKQTERRDVAWEYWAINEWRMLRVADGTLGFSRQEYVGFFGPANHTLSAEFGVTAYWLRIRPLTGGALTVMPRLQTLRLNTVPAINAETIHNELLGSSTGEPDQQFQLARSPALPDPQIQVLEPELPSEDGGAAPANGARTGLPTASITTNGTALTSVASANGTAPVSINGLNGTTPASGNGATPTFEKWVTWQLVSSFHLYGPESRCYMFDAISGEIRFGDGKHGKIPPVGLNNIRAAAYRVHNGLTGNVGASAITIMRNPSGALGGIRNVTNLEAAVGGLNTQPVEETERRGPQRLKHRQRSVTLEDFQWLTLEADYVARAYCQPTRDTNGARQPGWVSMVIVPQSTGDGQAAAKPLPSPALLREVSAQLENAALVNLRQFEALGIIEPAEDQFNDVDQIYVKGPTYVEVAVEASVVPSKPEQADEVKLAIVQRLEQFFHPLSGGPTQEGWAPGHDVYISEVAAEIENVAGVDHVTEINLRATSMQQQTLALVEALKVCFDASAGSQVSTFDERIKLTLAQPLAQGEQPQQLEVFGFRVGDLVKVVAEDNASLTENLSIAQLVGDDNIVLLAQPISDPAKWQNPAFALSTMDKRVRMEIDQCLFGYVEHNKQRDLRLTGFTLRSFQTGDQIILVHREHPRLRTKMQAIAPIQAQSLVLATEVVAPFDLPAGSQVVTVDERNKLILAQPWVQGTRTQQVIAYGFYVGESAKLVAEDDSILAANQTIDQITDDSLIIRFAQPTPDPTQWQKPAVALVATDGRVRLAIDHYLFEANEPPHGRLLGVVLRAFQAGDQFNLVHRELSYQRFSFSLAGAVTSTAAAMLPGASLTRISVPEDCLVCSGVHNINMSL